MLQAPPSGPSQNATTGAPETTHDTPAHVADAVTDRVRHARSVLICCVLAESFSPLPLRGLDIPAVQVRHAVDTALRGLPLEYLLGWRRRVAAWSVRWDAARHAASSYFPDDLPGEDEIPELDAVGEFSLSATERIVLTRLCQDTPARSGSRP
ncbi:hypothetical protein [Amycolatopsis alba]|uniref:Uncharacterized protein n=1 Tax=Amycolatopsis alba DSM 44262 TaxID=1125972 RepID=A0A229R8R7_AMYAL|nr:hypothetical protein [Amycolatopsis alba]OXM43062.1 hypothetical protein CFP75_40175 [Amycolatopsis alba DSM 44262]